MGITKPTVTGGSIGFPTVSGARTAAIKNWRGIVRKKYGVRYSYFVNAKDESLKISGSTGKYSCSVSAKPYCPGC